MCNTYFITMNSLTFILNLFLLIVSSPWMKLRVVQGKFDRAKSMSTLPHSFQASSFNLIIPIYAADPHQDRYHTTYVEFQPQIEGDESVDQEWLYTSRRERDDEQSYMALEFFRKQSWLLSAWATVYFARILDSLRVGVICDASSDI